MTLSDKDINSIASLIQQANQASEQRIMQKMDAKFDQVATQLDGLYANDGKREQEYLVISGQLERVEGRLGVLESDVAALKASAVKIEQNTNRLDERVTVLEKKCA